MTAKKLFLCIEDNEKFYLKAENESEAKNSAQYYNASVIKEVPMSHLSKNPNI